ncbi:MAG: J domain-containing protein [Pseudomonadota bacterium]
MRSAGREYELIAVLATTEAQAARRALGEALFVEEGALTAALASPAARRLWTTRKAVGRALVRRQADLEALHACAGVAPAAPGARFPDAESARRFLAANAAMLGAALSRFGGREQHQIVIDLPQEAALAAMKRRAEWPDLADALRAARAAAERRAAAARLAALAQAVREGLARSAEARLAAASLDRAQLPLAEETTALNIVALTDRGGAGALEAALEAIDAAWEGALRIKLIGPSPATSFGAILLDTPEPGAVAEAEALLKLEAAAGPEAVQAAYRAAMKRAHPDVAGEAATALSRRISAANRLMKRVSTARAALLDAGWAAPRGAGSPPLARLWREGDGVAAG